MGNDQKKWGQKKLKKKLNKVDISRAFVYCTDKSKEWTALRLSGVTDYPDVIYKYGKVEVNENEKNEEVSLQFDYDVLVSNDIPKEDLYKDENFKNLIGDILVHIIEEQLSTKDTMQYVNTDN
jgi:hypothetical protein